jgi:hypothetical protein
MSAAARLPWPRPVPVEAFMAIVRVRRTGIPLKVIRLEPEIPVIGSREIRLVKKEARP